MLTVLACEIIRKNMDRWKFHILSFGKLADVVFDFFAYGENAAGLFSEKGETFMFSNYTKY